tara:strand:+ start:456 stop:665 length:210 start_codon:yes stop_codon:yes gene_type:complete
MKSQVEGHPNLYKDTETGVIVNRAVSDRERYQIAKQQSRNSINTEQELSSLREEINEIKSLLKQLVDKP